MSKYIIFHPANQISKDEPGNEILWTVDFNLKSGEDTNIKIYIYDFLEGQIENCYPLTYIEQNLYEMGMEKKYDFPYKKEFYFVDQLGMEFIATLTALDINGFESTVKLKKKFAQVLLKDMNLPPEGNLHPERFLRSLSSFIDLSDEKYELYENNFDDLLDLENLCDRCLQYETNIEWKIINEVIK